MAKVLCQTLYGSTREVAAEQVVFRPSVYGIILHGGKLVLVTIRRTDTYGLPGGAVRAHEPLAAALAREVHEETGLSVAVGRQLHFKDPFFYYDPAATAYHTLSFFFLCTPNTFTLAQDAAVYVGESPEATCPQWVDLAQVPRLAIQPFFADVINLIRQDTTTTSPGG